MCLLGLVVGFHFSFMACFTNASDADRIAFGCCLAARCAAAFATSYPSQLLPLESHVKTNVNVGEAGQYGKRVTTQAVSDLRKLVLDLLRA